MFTKINKKERGFTLVEMLLVLVIVSSLIILGLGYLQQRATQIRIDRTAAQMEQILNAGLSYYVSNGAWPTSLSCLQGQGGFCTVAYLPTNLTNPWGGAYYIASSPGSPSPLFYVSTQITTADSFGAASALVSRLPLSYATKQAPGGIPANDGTCKAGSASCTVVASVNIPGQNLNNARAINFSGLYHNGSCVPVPTCPVDSTGTTMKPQIIAVPVQVSGMTTSPTRSSTCTETNLSGCQGDVYPISSFAAYASEAQPGAQPLTCAAGGGTQTNAACYADYNNTPLPTSCPSQPNGQCQYWRVCLSTVTEKGVVSPDNALWGLVQGTIMVVTRCVPVNEPAGSGFTVWSN